MSSIIRPWILAYFTGQATLGLGAVASAQERDAGEFAAQKDEEVFNKVPGQSTITYIRPEGSLVKKGDLVCELDSSTLKNHLATQEAATKGAEVASHNAQLPREAAEIAVTEYVEGTFKQEREGLLGRIGLAESVLKQAEDRRAKMKNLVEKGLASRERLVTEEMAVQRALLTLQQAQRKRDTLERYTKDKMIKTLQGEVEKARADELAKQAAYGLAKAAQERLQKQIENCRVLAPSNGRLRYSEPIEEAADVREGQLLFWVVPEEEPKAGENPERKADDPAANPQETTPSPAGRPTTC